MVDRRNQDGHRYVASHPGIYPDLKFGLYCVGVLTIFVWRIVAKSFCHFVLPPTFRFLSHTFTLPHRRFYTPATDYTSVPPGKGLRPIPSVIDLPSMVEYEVDCMAAASSTAPRRRAGLQIKNRSRGGGGGRQEMDEKVVARNEKGASANAKGRGEMEEPSGKDVKHYDADGECSFVEILMFGGGQAESAFSGLGSYPPCSTWWLFSFSSAVTAEREGGVQGGGGDASRISHTQILWPPPLFNGVSQWDFCSLGLMVGSKRVSRGVLEFVVSYPSNATVVGPTISPSSVFVGNGC